MPVWSATRSALCTDSGKHVNQAKFLKTFCFSVRRRLIHYQRREGGENATPRKILAGRQRVNRRSFEIVREWRMTLRHQRRPRRRRPASPHGQDAVRTLQQFLNL